MGRLNVLNTTLWSVEGGVWPSAHRILGRRVRHPLQPVLGTREVHGEWCRHWQQYVQPSDCLLPETQGSEWEVRFRHPDGLAYKAAIHTTLKIIQTEFEKQMHHIKNVLKCCFYKLLMCYHLLILQHQDLVELDKRGVKTARGLCVIVGAILMWFVPEQSTSCSMALCIAETWCEGIRIQRCNTGKCKTWLPKALWTWHSRIFSPSLLR